MSSTANRVPDDAVKVATDQMERDLCFYGGLVRGERERIARRVLEAVRKAAK